MDKRKMPDQLIIDPNMFINPPFIACPECSEQQFGVLMIQSYHYVRKCRACGFKKMYKLPHLKKKIIYLDQMAISDMMKSLNPQTTNETRSRLKPEWKTLFEKLDRLVKLQLIVCPDSTTHFEESVLWTDFYKAAKRMYEQLSGGASFYDTDTIRRFQIENNFRMWLGEKNVDDIEYFDVLHGGNLDGWQDRLMVSVDMLGQNADLIELIKKERDEIDTEVQKLFTQWQSETGQDFSYCYEKERTSFGTSLLKDYFENLFSDSLSSMLSQSSVIMAEINRRLRASGLDDETTLSKSIEYMRSQELKEVPYLKIFSAVFAALARRASAGQKRRPTRGMMNDVKTVASLAPYCDAMLVDKEVHSLLKDQVNGKSISDFLGLDTQFFSQSNFPEFMAHLDDIEQNADKSHLERVEEVYGETWGKPYLTMYDYDPSRE